MGWLRENDYQVPYDSESIIQSYADQKMYFLALKLRQNATVGDIQPIKITFAADQLMLPLRLASSAAVEDLPVLVWIFADTQYMSENYADATPDYSQLRGRSMLQPYAYSQKHVVTYDDLLEQIEYSYNGQAFVTEYAGPTANLDLSQLEDTLITDYVTNFPYLTRLRAQMSPEQITLDPIFIPAYYTTETTGTIDLEGYVDPLHYWGCSTREHLMDTSLVPQIFDLTAVRDGVEISHLKVAVPYDWELSEVDTPSKHVWIFARKAVNLAKLTAYMNGDRMLPMLVMAFGTDVPSGTSDYLLELVKDKENLSESEFAVVRDRIAHSSYTSKIPGQAGAPDATWVYALLTSDNDWQLNQPTYQAIFDYLMAYPYTLHPDLLHSLFIDWQEPLMYFGFPDGWTEHWIDDYEIDVMPDGYDVPMARLLNVKYFGGKTASYKAFDEAMDVVRDYYALPEDAPLDMFTTCRDIKPRQDVIEYKTAGRRGYIRIYGVYLLEVSVPEDQFKWYQDTLLDIAESMLVISPCG